MNGMEAAGPPVAKVATIVVAAGLLVVVAWLMLPHRPAGHAATDLTSAPVATTDGNIAAVHTGRTTCPGAATSVRANNGGQAADILEHVQAGLENVPGFLAVVDDGHGPIVVVDREQLDAWVATLKSSNIRVAPSCVGHEILVTTQVALAGIRLGPGEITTSGYDAISDAMVVSSTFKEDDLLALLAQQIPSAGDAVTNGTLRINEVAKGSITRQ